MKLLNLVVIASLSPMVSPLLAEGGRVENAPAPIGIYMSFDGSHADRTVQAMQHEVEALTKASAFRLRWRSLENRSSEDTFSDLMVVKFHGSCNMQGVQLVFSELGPETEGGVLGSTKTSDG